MFTLQDGLTRPVIYIIFSLNITGDVEKWIFRNIIKGKRRKTVNNINIYT